MQVQHFVSQTNERTTVESTMSVRKLALAITSRVNVLRKRIVANQRRIITAMAMATLATCSSNALIPNDCDAQEHTPVIDPFAFDPDFNWFEPIYQADFEDMKPQKRANRGWFATYDRMNLYVSRPEQEQGNTRLDSGWGNRFDLGFMLDEDNGWAATYINLTGPGQFDGTDIERLGRVNSQQLGGGAAGGGGGGGAGGAGGTAGPPFGQLFPEFVRNNPGFNTRFAAIRNSENVVDFDSLELNKTWRLEPYHYGGILEPLVGLRYMKFNDLYQRMSYQSGLFQSPVAFSADPLVTIVGAGEVVTTTRSRAENQMFGPQFGFRYFKYQDRFRYSGEMRVFTMGNWQSNRLQTTEELQFYGGTTVAPTASPLAQIITKTPVQYGANDEFAFGFDLRGEVSYQVSRMIELRAGAQLIDIAQGLWRGRLNDPLSRTDQQALLVGGTFGIAINR